MEDKQVSEVQESNHEVSWKSIRHRKAAKRHSVGQALERARLIGENKKAACQK
jgi:hypothetical protein